MTTTRVRFKAAVIPECLISTCGRFTIKPTHMCTGRDHDGGYMLVDLKTGGRVWGSSPENLKRHANNVPEGMGVHRDPQAPSFWVALS